MPRGGDGNLEFCGFHYAAYCGTATAGELAARRVENGAVPHRAADHIAVAEVHGVDLLLTWNCKHIANATMRQAIAGVCRKAGDAPPLISTPEELLGDNDA